MAKVISLSMEKDGNAINAFLKDNGTILIQESRIVKGSAEFDQITITKKQLKKIYESVFTK